MGGGLDVIGKVPNTKMGNLMLILSKWGIISVWLFLEGVS